MAGCSTVKDLFALYEQCRLCPRACGVNRSGQKRGFCGESAEVRVAFTGPHFGEEPPISGEKGSGTVFFTGCTLRCTFCQNHQISHEAMGKAPALDELLEALEGLVRTTGVHNINFVTPDHFAPHAFALVSRLRERGHRVPVVWNTSGYQEVSLLRTAEPFVDIYLPDFKYADANLAARLSTCRDYVGVALDAVGEMIRQKGFLDACAGERDLASKGVLVRHLILPGQIENSIQALTALFVEFGPALPVSLMSQYTPVRHHEDLPDLNRRLRTEEFDRVYRHAQELGFLSLFVQFPSRDATERPPFLPDFGRPEPFGSPGTR